MKDTMFWKSELPVPIYRAYILLPLIYSGAYIYPDSSRSGCIAGIRYIRGKQISYYDWFFRPTGRLKKAIPCWLLQKLKCSMLKRFSFGISPNIGNAKYIPNIIIKKQYNGRYLQFIIELIISVGLRLTFSFPSRHIKKKIPDILQNKNGITVFLIRFLKYSAVVQRSR